MIIERIRITAHPTGSQRLLGTLASLTGPVAVLPGCLGCTILQSCQDKNELQVQMEWESKEDLIRHLRSDTYKQLLLLMELSPKPPVIQFYAVQEFNGLDLVESARNLSN
jgi:quinol monooxygenase YgiN